MHATCVHQRCCASALVLLSKLCSTTSCTALAAPASSQAAHLHAARKLKSLHCYQCNW